MKPEKVVKKRIRRSKGTGEQKKYFHEGTQAAIVAYQASTDKAEKDKLYVKEIMPAFEKLAENLINIYKFTSLHETFDELKNDCVNFLFETIRKFDASRGTNAFSYFNVVAKNWLIIKTKQRIQRTKRVVSLDDHGSLSIHDQRIIDDQQVVMPQDVELENFTSAKQIVETLVRVRETVSSENELMCINSIITLFDNVNELDIINKSAILLYIREMSGLTQKQLTMSMQTIKKNFKKFRAGDDDNE